MMSRGERRLKRINVIVPIKNDFEAFEKLLDNISNYLFMYNHDIKFTIIDDTPKEECKIIGGERTTIDPIFERIKKRKLDNTIRYLKGTGTYGGSVKKGILRSGVDCDKLILMDVDHPFYLLPDIISLLDVNDVVIGNDVNINNERKVTKWLLRNTLGINMPHPTCGYMGFNKDVLGYYESTDKTIKFYFALSKRDMVHVELLYMCIKKNLSIGVVDFNTSGVGIKHNYGYMRSLKWLMDLSKTVFMDVVFHWYE